MRICERGHIVGCRRCWCSDVIVMNGKLALSVDTAVLRGPVNTYLQPFDKKQKREIDRAIRVAGTRPSTDKIRLRLAA